MMRLIDLLGLVGRNLFIVILGTVIIGGLSAAFAYILLPDEYEAEAMVTVLPLEGGMTGHAASAAMGYTQDRAFLEDVAERAGLDSADGLEVESNVQTATDNLLITVRGHSDRDVSSFSEAMADLVVETAETDGFAAQKAGIAGAAALSGPKRPFIVLVGVAAGFAVSVCLIVLRELSGRPAQNASLFKQPEQ